MKFEKKQTTIFEKKWEKLNDLNQNNVFSCEKLWTISQKYWKQQTKNNNNFKTNIYVFSLKLMNFML